MAISKENKLEETGKMFTVNLWPLCVFTQEHTEHTRKHRARRGKKDGGKEGKEEKEGGRIG